jgi:predicted nuclease of predicted toxin-antitoxin system
VAPSNRGLQGDVVPKFLIDECLSPDLAALARDCGFAESSHVTWLGKAGWKDWELKRFILEQDWTFVTRNSGDFRGPATQPGSKGQYADVLLHAGLICINGPDSMSAENEVELFGIVLDELGPDQMVNQAIEITLAEGEGGYELVRYDLPEPDGEGT